MEEKEKLDPDSITEDFIPLIEGKGACLEAVAWWQERSKLSIDELVSQLVIDDDTPQSWATWTLLVLGDMVHPDIRAKLFSKVKDPMMAFLLYCKLTWLTETEDDILFVKFHGKLPTAEGELASGIIKRAKK